MSPQVDAILQQIERLDVADRTLLERRLQELAENEWRMEADKARVIAQQLGIDQQSIDDTVQDLRYGS